MRSISRPASRPLSALLAAPVLALALGACAKGDARGGSAGGDAGGTMVVSTAADADFLFPPLVSSVTGRQVTDLLFDRLAEIGQDLNNVGDAGFKPRLADKWTWATDSLSIAFHLDPRALWHDGQPVRSSDVRYTYKVYTDPGLGSTTAPLLADIDSVSTPDSSTAVVWFKRRTPHQFFDATYQLVIVPEHVYGAVKPADLRTSAVVRQPVGSGRFRFVRWEPGQTIELLSDTANYRGRAKLDRIIYTVTPEYAAATGKLFAGEADFFEILRPEGIAELARHPDLKVVPYPSLAYGFLGFNLRDPQNPAKPHPIFGDAGVRRALSMAVDRGAVVKNVYDSLAYVGRGPFVRALSQGIDVKELPYDTAGANRLLDSLGWKRGADGTRARNGRPLAFRIVAPTSSATRMRMAVLIQDQLKQVGAKAEIEGLEFGAFVDRQQKHTFDSYFGAWNVDPAPGSVRQTWSTAGIKGAEGSNFGAYSSPAFDALVDSALAQMDPAKARGYYQRAYQRIIDDAPAIWVYEPRFFAGAHKRLQPTGLRADGWWADLPEWTIPAGQRIDRDRIGLRPVAAGTATAPGSAPASAPAGAAAGKH